MNEKNLAIFLSLLAGFSTMIGSLFMFMGKKDKKNALSFTFSFSFIIILFICIFDLAPSSYKYLILSYDYPFIMIFVLIIVGIVIGKLIGKIEVRNKKYDKKLYKLGITTFIILLLHNMPEGIITFMTSYENLSLGVMMTLVIAMHNIPEGIMVSMPIYYSTGSKLKGFLYSFASGIAEPIGAIIACLFLSNIITNGIIGIILAIVCGMMLYITIEDIYPIMKSSNGCSKILGIIVAIFIMLLTHFLH